MSNGGRKKAEPEVVSVIVVPHKARLSDLYVLGEETTIVGPVQLPDGTVEVQSIPVWVTKISPIEERDAAKAASRVRGVIQSTLREPMDDPAWDDYRYQIEAYQMGDREEQISFLIAADTEKFRMSARAELAASDKWAKDDYLNSLEAAWIDGGMKDAWLRDKDDKEAARVFKALNEFRELVNKEVDAEVISLRDDFAEDTDEEVYNKLLRKLVEIDTNATFVTELRKWHIYYATREVEDHSKLYFEDRDEVDILPAHVLAELVKVFERLKVDDIEGKD